MIIVARVLMNTKLLLAGAIIVILMAIFFGMFMNKEKFVGDFSYDSGFFKIDHDQFGGSGILEDAINQSRTDDPNADF